MSVRRNGALLTRQSRLTWISSEGIVPVVQRRSRSVMRWSLLVAVLSIVPTIGMSGCTTVVRSGVTETPRAPAMSFEIVGFYGAANDGGTFVRTVKRAPVEVGDRVQVSGTGFYDGTWTILDVFEYQDPGDRQSLWGYRIEPKWKGLPAGFTVDGSRVPANNTA